MDWSALLEIFMTPIAVAISGWLVSKVIVRPKDWERAATGEIIARAAAAQLVREFPDWTPAQLIKRLIDTVGDQIPQHKSKTKHRIAEGAVTHALAQEAQAAGLVAVSRNLTAKPA